MLVQDSPARGETGHTNGHTGHTARPAGFALFFHDFSTFPGNPGIYLEDLCVRAEHRQRGLGGTDRKRRSYR